MSPSTGNFTVGKIIQLQFMPLSEKILKLIQHARKDFGKLHIFSIPFPTILLTDGISDDKCSGCLNKWAHADAILSCNSEEVGFSLNETLDGGILPSHCVCHRGPCPAVSLPLFNDVVGDRRASIIFWRKPCQLAGVIG